LNSLHSFCSCFRSAQLEDLRNGNSDNLSRVKKDMERRLTKALVNVNSGAIVKEEEVGGVSHKKIDLCLACNRPLGKTVTLNASVPSYYGPKNEIGMDRRTSMLIKLEKDRGRRGTMQVSEIDCEPKRSEAKRAKRSLAHFLSTKSAVIPTQSVYESRNWTRWLVRPGASFCAMGLFRDGPKHAIFTPM